MTFYCDYCLVTDHHRFNCPALAKIAKDKEDHKLALQEAEDASNEELEAAGDLYDSLEEEGHSRECVRRMYQDADIELSEDEKVRRLPINPDL